MESLREELSQRTKRNISDKKLLGCMNGLKNIKDVLEERLKFNYSLMIPNAWIHHNKNTPRESLIDEYLREIEASRFANRALGLKSKNTIRLATYNIHYWTDSFQTPNVNDLLTMIGALDIDILALQEALMPYNSATQNSRLNFMGYMDPIQHIPETSIDEISKTGISKSIHTTDGWNHENIIDDIGKAGFEYIAASAASTTHSLKGTFFGNAIVSTKNAPMTPGALGFTLPPYGQGRSATVTFHPEVYIADAKKKGIFVVSVHLDVFDDSGAARLLQIRHLISQLNILENENENIGVPFVLMGDMNSLKKEDYTEWELSWLKNNNKGIPLEFDTIKEIEKAGFTDVFDVQNRCGLKSSTWSARRIDYIFTKGIPPSSIFSTYAYYSHASDHIPLIVDFVTGPQTKG